MEKHKHEWFVLVCEARLSRAWSHEFVVEDDETQSSG